MLTFTGLRNLYGDLTNDNSTTNLTLGDTLLNNSIRKIISSHDWDFLEKTRSISTIASQQFYQLPEDFHKLISVTVTISTTVYTPVEISSREQWDILNQSTNVTSNTPEFFYVFENQLGFYPKPTSTTTNGITYIYKRNVRDLSRADFSTGTILTATNGSTALVGTTTAWVANFIGRFIRITNTDIANTGDGVWYEISTVPSATSITLSKNYNGTSIVAGTATYLIGEVGILPENFQILSVYDAVAIYYQRRGEATQAREWERKYNEMLKQLKTEHGSKSTSVSVLESDNISQKNSNLYVTL